MVHQEFLAKMKIKATPLVVGAGIALTSDEQDLTIMLRPGETHTITDRMRHAKSIRNAIQLGYITVEMDHAISDTLSQIHSDFVAQVELETLATLVNGISGLVVGISGMFSGFSGIGYSGFSGYSGLLGQSGWSGLSGYSAFSGESGQSGTSGFSAFSGQSGFSGGGTSGSGISGISGWSGISGFSGYSPHTQSFPVRFVGGSTSPSEVYVSGTLLKVIELDSTKNILLNFEMPKQWVSTANPSVEVSFITSSTGSGNGTVDLRAYVRYVQDAESANKANDETLNETVSVTNTLTIQNSVTFILNKSLISNGDVVNMDITNLGTGTFNGKIGIIINANFVFLGT